MVLQAGNYTIGGDAAFLSFPIAAGNATMGPAAGRTRVQVLIGTGGYMFEVPQTPAEEPLGLYSSTQVAEDQITANGTNRTLFRVVDTGGAANTYTIRTPAGLALTRVGNEVRFRVFAAANAAQVWIFTNV